MSVSMVGKSLNMARLRAAGGWVVSLAGTLDDSLDAQALIDGLGDWIVFDLEGVTRITSFGVREWMRALSQLPAGVGYVFVRCQPSVLMQFNMVSRFGGAGTLVSFFAPYICPQCGAEHGELVDLRRQHAEVVTLQLPDPKCKSCSTTMEFDDVPESYLAFASGQPAPKLAPLVDQLIDNPSPLSTTPTRKFRVEMSVADGVTRLNLTGALDDRASFKRIAGGLEGTVLIDLGRVEATTDAGVSRLVAFLEEQTVRSNLIHVPVGAASALAELAERAPAKVALLSLSLPFWCDRCSAKSQSEADAPRLEELRQTNKGPICKTCGEPTSLGMVGAQRDKMLAIQLSKAEGALAVYLTEEVIVGEDIEEVIDANSLQNRVIAGRYEVGALIGMGGMAEIYAARQRGPQGFDRQVALKRILPHLCRDPEFLELFLQEARVAARLSHPNIVQIIELGQDGDSYFMAMELVRGWDLRAILRMMVKTNTGIPVHLAGRIALDVASALRGAHEHVDDAGKTAPVVHRDVSPHNILISDRGVVKLTDFGIAKAADATGATPGGAVRGKLNYISPERLLGQVGPLDPRPDVFALVIILYQMLTWNHPFGAPNDVSLIKQVVELNVTPPEALRPDLPRPIVQFINKGFSRKLEQRFANGREFSDLLERALAEVPRPPDLPDLAAWLGELVRKSMETPDSRPPSKSSTLATPSSLVESSGSSAVAPDVPAKK